MERGRLILEIADVRVDPARCDEYEAAFAIAQNIIMARPGFVDHELRKSQEDPGRYALLIHWDSVASHEDGFRQSPEYQEWKALLHHFYIEPPTVEHFDRVLP